MYESGEKTLSYNEVLTSISLIGQKHVSFDMILDALLFNSIIGDHLLEQPKTFIKNNESEF